MLAAVTPLDERRPAAGRIIPEPLAPGEAPPDSPLALQLASLWEELLGAGPPGLHDDFFARGGSSLTALRLVREVQARLGRVLPLEVFLEHATLGRMIEALERGAPPVQSGLLSLRPGRDGTPLALFHPAGGSALCYLDLARRLPWRRPVQAVHEPPGLAERAPSLVERASAYAALLERARPQAAWCLAGHSFGGLVAFEVARRLERPPAAVVLIDATAPGQGGWRDEDDFVARLADALEGADLDAESDDAGAEQRLWSALRDVAGDELARVEPQRAGRARLGDVERFCRRLRFVPQRGALGYRELRAFLRSLRAALRSARAYVAEPYAGRVVLLQAAAASASWRRDQARRWRDLAPRLEQREIPGRHLDLLGEPHVASLAARLFELLGELDGAVA